MVDWKNFLKHEALKDFKNIYSPVLLEKKLNTKDSIDLKLLKTRFKLNPKQQMVDSKQTRIITNHGAIRAGKTVFNVFKTLEICLQKKPVKNEIVIVVGATVNQAVTLFKSNLEFILNKSNMVDNILLPTSEYINSFILLGHQVRFYGGQKRDNVGRIKSLTAFHALIFEATEILECVYDVVFDRLSANPATFLIDTNPASKFHWFYKKNIAHIVEGKKEAINWVYYDNVNFLRPDYFKEMDILKFNKNPRELDVSREIHEKLLTKEIEPFQIPSLYKNAKITTDELRNKYGLWVSSDATPFSEIGITHGVKGVGTTFAFLDPANVSGKNNSYTAIVAMWVCNLSLTRRYIFAGKLFSKPYFSIKEPLKNFLREYRVDKFYYETNLTGRILDHEFREFCAEGVINSENKITRILKLECPLATRKIVAHDSCDTAFLEQIKNFEFIEKTTGDVAISPTDAPDALESVYRLFISTLKTERVI